MKLLDTNVFVYAQGRPHLYYEPCRALVDKLGDDSSGYTIDTELLREILHVYSVRGERLLAFSTFDRLLVLFSNPIPITREVMVMARHLLERYPALSARDAIHAAVVQTQGLEGIVTTDQVFHQIREVVAYDPLEMASGTA